MKRLWEWYQSWFRVTVREPRPPAAEIDQAAAERGLGRLAVGRELADPRMRAAQQTGVGVLFLVLAWLAAEIGVGAWQSLSVVFDAINLFFLVSGVFLLAAAVRTARRGPAAFFGYADGLVYAAGGQIVAFPWAQCRGMRPVIGRSGMWTPGTQVTAYALQAPGDLEIRVPLVVTDGRDEFVNHLLAAIQAHGRPVG